MQGASGTGRIFLFVCLLINYNVAYDRTNVMAMINVRQRINVPETGHVQAHTIKILGPTSKGPNAPITHTPDKMTPQEHKNQSLQTIQSGTKAVMETHWPKMYPKSNRKAPNNDGKENKHKTHANLLVLLIRTVQA